MMREFNFHLPIVFLILFLDINLVNGFSNPQYRYKNFMKQTLIRVAVQVPPSSKPTTIQTWLTARNGNNNDDDDDDDQRYFEAVAHNKARTDVRNFLTQRAIQSFIYLLISCRDPHTVRWLEERYDFKNSENYHGTGFFNLTKWSQWDSILVDLLHRPPDVVIVSARRRGRGHGGWSTNNPYMEERFVEFEIDIDPVSLTSRIISVREQIAKEWVDDLDTLMAANDMILSSYNEYHITSRDGEDECVNWSADDTTNATVEECFQSEHFSSLREGSKLPVFDRNAMMMLSNSMSFDEFASSPYRKGNFDLLYLLLTQESIHRVLREYRSAGEKREVSYTWFREFYTQRAASHFDGSQNYGRADDFLEELLKTPPSTRTFGNNKIGLIDPLRIAEDVIRVRSQVAEDWQNIVARAPQDHMGLRKLLLVKQMGKNMVNPSPFAKNDSAMDQGGFE